jgi:hypothetical protein
MTQIELEEQELIELKKSSLAKKLWKERARINESKKNIEHINTQLNYLNKKLKNTN